MTREGSKNLAASIIKVAVEDLKDALEKLKQNPDNSAAKVDVFDTFVFFQGDWFETLCHICDMDPDFIRNGLKENLGYDEQRILESCV